MRSNHCLPVCRICTRSQTYCSSIAVPRHDLLYLLLDDEYVVFYAARAAMVQIDVFNLVLTTFRAAKLWQSSVPNTYRACVARVLLNGLALIYK